MQNLENTMREVVKKLLKENKVDLIIGYERGSLPLRTSPCLIDKAADASKLVWNASCDANLAKYLIDREGKIGIVAKGCDARAITVCTVEKQISKENIVIIGIPCQGVLDMKKIQAELDGKDILEAKITGEQIKVKGGDFEKVLVINDFLCDSCLTCQHMNPSVYDVFVGKKAPEISKEDEFAEVSDIESKSTEERWKHFQKELSKCIRCYACRNVCPLCYCKMCFVDQTMPMWFGKTSDLSDTMIYHIVRTFHVAGRCVDCGVCSRACPMDINLRDLVKKTEKIMKERYGYEAGVSLEEVPPLGNFKMDDSEEFIE